jgi:pyruvate dehydrogenase E2 component (dihydrolipoamide acetyltransferase)
MSTFALPDLGEGLQDAEIVAWHVGEGDHVVADAPLVSVETEKAVVEVPSPRSGYIRHLLAALHERVKVGAPIVEFDDAPHVDTGTVVGDLGAGPPTPAAPGPSPAVPASGAASPKGLASPAIRALAHERGIDLTGITGTGPNGTITRADLEHAGGQKPAAGPSASPTGNPVALTGIRRSMAVNMAKAHAEVVPATVWDEADIGLWWTGRGDITVRLVRAIAVARAAEPVLNAWYDGQAMTLRTFERIDLGIAVDFEGGLIVPVLRDAGARPPASLRADLDRLKTAARDRSVPLADLRDPTITLSNYGMLAGRQAALVVVPPQVAIIGAGRIHQLAVPGAGTVAFTHVLPLSLTFDHRVATGGEAGRFLRAMMDDLRQMN